MLNFKLDIRIKLITALLSVTFIASTPKGNFQILGLYFLPCLIITIFFKPPFLLFLKRIFIAFLFPFSVSVFLPFTNKGDLLYSLNLYFFNLQITDNGMIIFFTTIIKAFLSVIVLAALVTSSGDLELLDGLRKIHFPQVIVSVIFLMYRYLFLIRDEAKTGKLAINSRVFQKSYINVNRHLAFLAGSLFIKSHDRAENIYKSMESRGFTGDFNYLPGKNGFSYISIVILSVFILAFAGIKCLELFKIVS